MLAIFSQVESVWPVTVAGWVTLVASLGTLIILPITYGKWLEKMNGLGRRTKKLEDRQERREALDAEWQRQIDRILGQHEGILKVVGEAKRSAEHCHEDAEEHAIMLGAKLDETFKAVNRMELGLSQRLTAIETEIRIRKGDAREKA